MIIYCKRVDSDRYVLYCEICLIDVLSVSGQVLARRLAEGKKVACKAHQGLVGGQENDTIACLLLQKSAKEEER